MPLVVSALFCFGNEEGVLISGTFSRWHTATEVKRHTRQLQRGHSPYRGFQRQLQMHEQSSMLFHLGTFGSPSRMQRIVSGISDRSAVADRRSNLDDVRGPLLIRPDSNRTTSLGHRSLLSFHDALCHTCAMAAGFGTERDGTEWAQREFELNKSKAIDGNHLSCFRFSIALRGFESRPGHCKRWKSREVFKRKLSCATSVPQLLSESLGIYPPWFFSRLGTPRAVHEIIINRALLGAASRCRACQVVRP
jgi:hypothetical protein